MIFLIYLGIGLVVAVLTIMYMTHDVAGVPPNMDFFDYLTVGTCGLFVGASWPAMILIAPFALIAFLINLRRERKNS